MKKDHYIGNPSTEFCNSWHKEKLDYQLRLCDILIRENVRKLFKLEEDFSQVIKKTKVNINFLFKLRFHLDRVKKKQQKFKLKKLLTFNITYYPVFQNTKTILEELQILLAPDKEHQKV